MSDSFWNPNGVNVPNGGFRCTWGQSWAWSDEFSVRKWRVFCPKNHGNLRNYGLNKGRDGYQLDRCLYNLYTIFLRIPRFPHERWDDHPQYQGNVPGIRTLIRWWWWSSPLKPPPRENKALLRGYWPLGLIKVRNFLGRLALGGCILRFSGNNPSGKDASHPIEKYCVSVLVKTASFPQVGTRDEN